MTTTVPAAPPSAAPTREVVGLRLHTHGEVSPAWVRDAVVPLWQDARAGGRQLVTLRRGWLGGAHVDLAGVGPEATSTAWAAVAARADAGPAPEAPVDPEAYLDRARVRGRLEGVEPPYLPLRDHGCVLLLDRSALPGTGSALAPLRGVADGVLAPAVVRSVTEVADGEHGAARALVDVLTLVAGAHALGPGFGTFSLRSHVEALLRSWSGSDDLRGRFAARYAEQREPVVERVRTLLDGDGGGTATGWRTALAYVSGVVDESVRRGDLTNALVDAAARGGSAPEHPAGPDHPDTDFHRTVYGAGVAEAAGEWFAGYRFLVNCVYGQLPLLGISPVQRAYGCWAVAEAVDEVLGQSWTDRLATATATTTEDDR